jgi:hypothetical protein
MFQASVLSSLHRFYQSLHQIDISRHFADLELHLDRLWTHETANLLVFPFVVHRIANI